MQDKVSAIKPWTLLNFIFLNTNVKTYLNLKKMSIFLLISTSRLSPRNSMVPAEFATMLEMTLYKLVGNNLIPKNFVNSDFWRKLRTKFTNAGQYAKISSKKISKIKSKPLKSLKIPPQASEPSLAATPARPAPSTSAPSPPSKQQKVSYFSFK